jgi:Secretion system C-terminal sorting domain
MKHLIVLCASFVLITTTYSQSNLTWSKDFSTGLDNYYSKFPSIRAEADTLEVIGRKNTPNGQRLLIVKYNLLGDTISTKTYGNDLVLNNEIIDYKLDSLDNIYILNKEKIGFYKAKIVLQKYSLNGDLIWVEQVQSLSDTSYTPCSLGIINDSTLFFNAYKEYDYPLTPSDVINTTSLSQLFAFHSDGTQLWKREFNPSTEISWFAYDVFVHNNMAFLFGNNVTGNLRLVKVDINNNLSTTSCNGILNGINDVQLSPDNNLIITAWTSYRISKVDLNGALIWSQLYPTNLPSNVSGDEAKATIQDSLGNFYVTGRHYGLNYGTSSYTNADILTLKYDSSGNLIWQNRYEYGINNADIANTLILKNGQVYVGGNSQRLGVGTDYDYVVLKIDASTGLSTGVYRYNGLANGDDAVSSLCVFDNGSVALTGLSYMDTQFGWTTQYLKDVTLSVPALEEESKLLIFPNPTSETITISFENENNGHKTCSLVDASGREFKTFKLTGADTHMDISELNQGIYFIKIGNWVEKIIVK